jgi:Flp pilus assembly pilin Flp
MTMRRSPSSLLRALRRDESGASIVEMGFLLPILAVMVAAIIDLSMGISERFSLQQAINRSLEMVQANRPTITLPNSSAVDYTFLRQEVATAAKVPVGNVALTRWLECSGSERPFEGSCLASEDTARYLRLRVTKNFVGKLYVKTVPLEATGAVRIQ